MRKKFRNLTKNTSYLHKNYLLLLKLWKRSETFRARYISIRYINILSSDIKKFT